MQTQQQRVQRCRHSSREYRDADIVAESTEMQTQQRRVQRCRHSSEEYRDADIVAESTEMQTQQQRVQRYRHSSREYRDADIVAKNTEMQTQQQRVQRCRHSSRKYRDVDTSLILAGHENLGKYKESFVVAADFSFQPTFEFMGTPLLPGWNGTFATGIFNSVPLHSKPLAQLLLRQRENRGAASC